MDGSLGQILDVNHVCSLHAVSCGQYCDYAGVQLRRESGAPQRRLSRSLSTAAVLHLHIFRLLLLVIPDRNPCLHELFVEVKTTDSVITPTHSIQSFPHFCIWEMRRNFKPKRHFKPCGVLFLPFDTRQVFF